MAELEVIKKLYFSRPWRQRRELSGVSRDFIWIHRRPKPVMSRWWACG